MKPRRFCPHLLPSGHLLSGDGSHRLLDGTGDIKKGEKNTMTKENNPCGGLALGLALEPRTVRVDLNKLKKLSEDRQGWCYESVLHYAIEGFLAQGSPEMSHELFGRIVSEYRADPQELLPDPSEQETSPPPEWSATIEVVGDRMKMTVSHNGEELVYGKSYVQESDDLGMMQAISYAAHMCYKMVQQKNM